jgi:hypothetical protein
VLHIKIDKKLSNQQQEQQTRNNQLNLQTAKTIDQIRNDGLDKQTLERIAAERAEMERAKQEAKERLPGQFTSLKQDKETRTFLFTGAYQKLEVPAKDFVTKQIIPGKMVTKFRFQVYDVTDPDSPSDVAIWERGNTEADQVLYWLANGKPELTIMRNGAPNSQKTTYNIFPAK